MNKTIDLTQAHSVHEAAAVEQALYSGPRIITSDHHSQVTLESLRQGLITGIKDLQDATGTALKEYDATLVQYFNQTGERINALNDQIEKLELVIDSLVKLFALSEKMPDDVLLAHQTVLADFLRRDFLQAEATDTKLNGF